MGAGGGFVVGLTVAGHLTWPGVAAVAGVAAVIVTATGIALQHSDRRYVRRREYADHAREEAARKRAIEEEQGRVLADANAVYVVGRGGGGTVDGAFVRCEEVTFELSNGATRPISRIQVELDPLVELRGAWSSERPTSLGAGQSTRWAERTADYVVPLTEASGHALRTRAAVVTFTLDGRTWRKRQVGFQEDGVTAELIDGRLPTAD